ncbi:hypothetical protein [Sphingobacterium sp. 18053]|uniref:hypothetical protein n=1 Tax=Sphingobacterium sp. 18053 TaxID=2681401 RepID=UPI001358ED5A|nr:hypothetical protein [Sphingobacterium sp. 18053]
MIIDKKLLTNSLFFNVAPYTIIGEVTLKLTKEASNKESSFTIIPTKITERFIEVKEGFEGVEEGKYRYQLIYNNSVVDSGFIRVIGEDKEVAIERPTEVRKVIDGRKK